MWRRKQTRTTSRLPRVWAAKRTNQWSERSNRRQPFWRRRNHSNQLPIERNRRLYAAERVQPARPPILLPPFVKQLIIVIILVIILVAVLFSPLFNIQSVSVKDNSLTSGDAIKSNVPHSGNIWRFTSGSLEKKLKSQFPAIADIVVYKQLPSTILVQVAERQPIALWRAGNTAYLVDQNGVAFAVVDDQNRYHDLPVIDDPAAVAITLGQTVALPRVMTFIQDAKRRLATDEHLEITNISLIETTFDVAFQTKDGWRILLATDRQLAPQIAGLDAVLKAKRDLIHDYIDLRVSGLAFVK